MQCPACGQKLAEGTKYCPSCGAAVPTYVQEEEKQFETVNGEVYQEPDREYSHHPDMPMKWYKFLVYISLLLTGVSNVFTGVQAIKGMHYGDAETAKQVYQVFGTLKYIDVVYGVCLIIVGVYALVVRHWLVRFSRKGPAGLLGLYGVSFVMTIVYLLGVSAVVGTNMIDTTMTIQMVISIGMIIANKVYFDKRKHMFVN